MSIEISKKSKELISEHITSIISDRLKVLECNHIWTDYGHGYKCNKCEYYTGQWGDLNKLIKNEIID